MGDRAFHRELGRLLAVHFGYDTTEAEPDTRENVPARPARRGSKLAAPARKKTPAKGSTRKPASSTLPEQTDPEPETMTASPEQPQQATS